MSRVGVELVAERRLLAFSREYIAPALEVWRRRCVQSNCASSRVAASCAGSRVPNWFWSMLVLEVADAPRSPAALARPAGRSAAAVVEFAKSWSTGVRKKSEYSVVPAARQWRSATFGAADGRRAALAVTLRLS